MYRPKLGAVGSFLFQLFVEILELVSIVLGFYAIIHTSSDALIKAEDDSVLESALMVNLAVATRTYVIAALSVFAIKFILSSVVGRFIEFTPY